MPDKRNSWINAHASLPEDDSPVLVISKFHHISSQQYTDYDIPGAPKLFRPDGYRAGDDVSFWMPVPEDGWKEFEVEQPQEAGFYLTKENYGSVVSQHWEYSTLSGQLEFRPLGTGFNMGRLKYWREIPPLPKGVILK